MLLFFDGNALVFGGVDAAELTELMRLSAIEPWSGTADVSGEWMGIPAAIAALLAAADEAVDARLLLLCGNVHNEKLDLVAQSSDAWVLGSAAAANTACLESSS